MKLTTRDLSWQEALDELAPAWEAIVRERDLNPAMLPGWLDARGRSRGVTDTLRVVACFEHDRLRGVAPYRISDERVSGLPVRMLRLESAMLPYHNEIVTDAAPEAVVAALFEVTRTRGWTVFHANAIRTPSPSADGIRSAALGIGGVTLDYPGERSPVMEIDCSWDELLASKRKKFRYKLKRRRKDLERSGEIALRWLNAPQDVPSLLDAMMRIEARSWKVAAGMAISHDAEERAYYEALLPWMASNDLLHANVLDIDDVPAAYSLCYRWNGRIGQLKTSFDDAFAAVSPGAVVIEDSIRAAVDGGDREFDFLGDVMGHKMEWAGALRAHETLYVYANSVPIRLLGRLKQAMARRRRAAAPAGDAAAVE